MVEHSERSQGLVRFANFGVTALILVVGAIVTALGYSRRFETPALLLLGFALDIFGLVVGLVSFRWPGWRQGTNRRS